MTPILQRGVNYIIPIHYATARLVADDAIADAQRGPGVHAGLWLFVGEALRCACGSDDVIAVRPGCEHIYGADGAVLVARGVPVLAWCCRCWPVTRGARDVQQGA